VDQREGIFIFGDLKSNAMVQYQRPSSCVSLGEWNDTGPYRGGWGHVVVKMTLMKK
jgi:hypothetical protein